MDDIFREQITGYRSEMEGIRGVSSNTVKSYLTDIKQFAEFLKTNSISSFYSVNERIIRTYLSFLNDNGLEKATIGRKLSSLRSFYDYLLRTQNNAGNVLKHIKNPKVSRNLPEIIPDNTFVVLLDSIKKNESPPDDLIFSAILELLYGCALRVSEVCSLKLSDVSLDAKSLRVLGKGSKYRIVPLGSKSVLTIKQYMTWRISRSEFDNLLLTSKRKPVYERFVYRIVNKYLKEVASLERNSPHILRHSAATHMMNNGADLMAVKEILGHENLSTTQIYTHVSIEMLKKAYKSAHPKS